MLRFCRPKQQSAVKSPSVDLWYADDPPEATGRTPWCDSTLPFSRGAPTQSSCWILSQWLVQCLSSLESPKRYTISWKQISISSVYPVYHQYIQYIISISTFYCGWELRMMRMHRWYGPILAISLKQGMYSVLSFACWLGVPSLSPSISWDHHHPHFDVSHTHTYIYIIFICMYTHIYIYIRMCFCIYIYTHISWSQKMFGFFICWAQNTGMGHGSRPWHPVSFTPGTFPKRWVPAVALGPQLPRAERGHQVVTAWYDERWLGNGLFIDDLHMKNGDSMGL